MEMVQLLKSKYARSPTLDTVLMVEHCIDNNSGEFTRRDLWKKLPKKVMWQTYLTIVDYLQSINKIGWDKTGKLVYIWNPELTKLARSRPEYVEKLKKIKQQKGRRFKSIEELRNHIEHT